MRYPILAKRRRRCLPPAVISLLLATTSLAQEPVAVPEAFVNLEAETTSLAQGMKLAQDRAQQVQPRDRYWVAYRFPLRDGIKIGYYRFHDHGGVSINRDGDTYFFEDADLETHILHALSELGDEEAKAEFQERQQQFLRSARNDWGLFLQFDSDRRDLIKIKLLRFSSRFLPERLQVYWLGDITVGESFDFLKPVIENDDKPAKLVEPAILAISLHDDSRVIPFLTEVASSERYLEIRKSAAFWLGQIPDEASFDALSTIFAREDQPEMKERLVFAISQHESERVVPVLAEIARNDDDVDVREKAVFWLGQIDREETLDILLDLLRESESRQLKEKIVFSISQHDSERAVDTIVDIARNDRDREVREKAVFWLGQMAGRKTLKVLGDIVDSDDETEVKEKAVFAISQHDDRELAFTMLMDIARNNPNPNVRKKAMFWMGQMGDQRAVDFFREILTEN